MTNIDVLSHNREAWDREVERGNQWTKPVASEVIAEAKRGVWNVVLTPKKPVPAKWFPTSLRGCRVLCLASGGGQQAPILAAAGAEVVVLDNSPRQLARDQEVAKRDGLSLQTILGDMAKLDCFADSSFDLVFHPCSNCFVPDVRSVWREVARVLRPGGSLLAGFINPVAYIFDPAAEAQGELKARFKVPYSDVTSIDSAELERYTGAGSPLEFGHSLTDQLQGQMAAGLALVDFYEDDWDGARITDKFFPAFIASCAVKLGK